MTPAGFEPTTSWVKAHAGNYGNETADKLAKEAARSQKINMNTIEYQ
jgi:ribonuclease HI